MDLNFIRAGIFIVAGILVMIFTDGLLRLQDRLFRKVGIRQRDTNKSTFIVGIVLILIGVGLILVSVSLI